MSLSFDYDAGIYTLGEPDADIEAALDGQYKRIGHLKWKTPSLPRFDDVVSFFSATTSGRCSDETYELRMQSCLSCPLIDKTDGELYCGACRCGRRSMARLDDKLRWEKIRCPLGRPGFMNAKESPHGD